jgi:hypothetical protein
MSKVKLLELECSRTKPKSWRGDRAPEQAQHGEGCIGSQGKKGWFTSGGGQRDAGSADIATILNGSSGFAMGDAAGVRL